MCYTCVYIHIHVYVCIRIHLLYRSLHVYTMLQLRFSSIVFRSVINRQREQHNLKHTSSKLSALQHEHATRSSLQSHSFVFFSAGGTSEASIWCFLLNRHHWHLNLRGALCRCKTPAELLLLERRFSLLVQSVVVCQFGIFRSFMPRISPGEWCCGTVAGTFICAPAIYLVNKTKNPYISKS